MRYGIRHERGKDEDIEENHAAAAEIFPEHARGAHHLYLSGMPASLPSSQIHCQALAGVSRALTPITALVPGGFTMAEFMVAIDHITYYAVRAKDEVSAIDLVLEGEGEEISSETRDAYITEYQSSDFIAR
jgi:hypothetical protein